MMRGIWAGVFGDWEISQSASAALGGLERSLSAALLDFDAAGVATPQPRASSPQLLYGEQRLLRCPFVLA